MFDYRLRLFYPVNVEHRDPVFGKELLEHYGGKNSEFSAAVQYINHLSNMPNHFVRELLGHIAAEELGHMQMIAMAINKLGGPFPSYINSQEMPWNIECIDQCLDPVAMLEADIEAENRSRELYRQHITMTKDSGLTKMLYFLSEREYVHKKLLQKAKNYIQQGANVDEFTELINEYKMSLHMW
ncbi:MAG: manganese catalase family protein [Desulfitobacteriaceae bacterium]|nr:manganese catalase family protein [Desulfitobacteriaceae bacterium]MDD4346216.1 manganese catalase family protein [Desulfitobacteriaceae bacterium]MDD4400848.1 manganese catalase family protein [Desulfitobacteriaceae bacterium]